VSDRAGSPLHAKADEPPPGFGDVLRNREFRAIFSASALSLFGDYAARSAVTALVYKTTNSALLSAIAFAVGYLPSLGFGSVLAALAERYSPRKAMIFCDIVRFMIMVLIAFTLTLPIWALLLLLFVNALLSPPFEASRSSLTPRILTGESYVVGLSLQRIAGQSAVLVGYGLGASLSAYDPSLALLINAATFAFSGLAVFFFVREREPVLRPDDRTHLLRETVEGYSVVFRSPVLRAVALIAFGGAAFGIVPEGLAAAWAGQLTTNGPDRGWFQAAIMTAASGGFVAGTILATRFASSGLRSKLIRPLAIISPLVLVPALLKPGIVGVVAITALSGVTLAGVMPATNAIFVQALNPAFRARAFSVMQTGLHLVQGGAVAAAGWLALKIHLVSTVVGLWSAAGVVVMVLVGLTWPDKASIADTIAANQLRVAAADGHKPKHAANDFSEDTLDLGRPIMPQRRPRPSPAPATRRPVTRGIHDKGQATGSDEDVTVQMRLPSVIEPEDPTVPIETPVPPAARSDSDGGSNAADRASAR